MKHQKKIGLIISNRNFGGQESRYLKIGFALFERNEKVFIFVNQYLYQQIPLRFPAIWENKEFMENVIKIKLSKSSKAQSALHFILFHVFKLDPFLLRARKPILAINPDILVSNKDVINLRTLRRYYKRTLIKDYTSPENVDRSFNRKDYKYYHLVNKFFFVSPSVHSRWIKKLSDKVFNPEKEYFTFNIPFFDDNPSEVDFQKKNNTIVFAHRFMDRKNPLLFANVIRMACKDCNFDSWSFGFYGRGPLKAHITKILQEGIKTGRVDFSFTNRLDNKLRTSKIFVSLIEPDNFPSQSVLEAMNYGNVLLISDTGKSNVFISDNGELVELDAKDILEKLKTLISSDLFSMGKNSIDLLKERFSKEVYLSTWIKNVTN